MRCALIILIAVSWCFGAAQIDSLQLKKLRADSAAITAANIQRAWIDTVKKGFVTLAPIASDANYAGFDMYRSATYLGYLASSNDNPGAGVYFAALGQRRLFFLTNSVTRMIIDSNGRVGINNVNPDKRLTVTGSVKADTILSGQTYSLKDTAHIGKFDSLIINNELLFPVRWDDCGEINLSQSKTTGSAGNPTWTATGAGYYGYTFAINDSLQGQIEIYHKFIEGDTLHWHFHWMTNGMDASNRYVNWSIHFICKNIGDSVTYESTGTKQDTILANTKSRTHKFTEIYEFPTPNLKIGAYVFVIIKRIAASPATNPTGDPFGITIGLHRKVNSIGSHTETTK